MTQKQRVLQKLQGAPDGVSSKAFIQDFMPRVAARIQELRDEGYPITSERCEDDPRYVIYKLQERRGVETINKTHARLESEPVTPGYSGPGLREEQGDESVLPVAAPEERLVPSMFDYDADWVA